jgi:hypothetical protein
MDAADTPEVEGRGRWPNDRAIVEATILSIQLMTARDARGVGDAQTEGLQRIDRPRDWPGASRVVLR